jgi:hypothetical protein
VNLNLVYKSITSWVSTRVHSWVDEEKQDMVVGKGEEGNNMAFHMVVDIEVHHT